MVFIAHPAILYSCETTKTIRMGVAMRDATLFEPIRLRTRSDINDIITSTIDHSNVSLPTVPSGKHHPVSSFKLLLLASLFASYVTNFCPTIAADDFTPSLIWKTTSSTARNGVMRLLSAHTVVICPPRSAPFFPKSSRFFIYHLYVQISALYALYMPPFSHVPGFSPSSVLIMFETWARGQIN